MVLSDNKTEVVGILVKEEICEDVLRVRKRCDKSHDNYTSLRRSDENDVCVCTTKWKTRCMVTRKRYCMRKWRVGGVWQIERNWCGVKEILIVVSGNVRKHLKVYMEHWRIWNRGKKH